MLQQNEEELLEIRHDRKVNVIEELIQLKTMLTAPEIQAGGSKASRSFHSKLLELKKSKEVKPGKRQRSASQSRNTLITEYFMQYKRVRRCQVDADPTLILESDQGSHLTLAS